MPDVTPELLISVAQRARKNETVVREAIRTVGQKTIAELVGESETTISRAKGDLDRLCAILAAAGLKLVPIGHRTYSEERIRALNTLAKIGLEASDTTPGDLD